MVSASAACPRAESSMGFVSKDEWISLVGGIPAPLKNMSSSVGMMKFPIYGKS
jgi:hypothetical protein